MSSQAELVEGNARFVESFVHGGLPREPRRSVGVITCMDARIEPLALLGLELGDATVLRNAGALVTDDVLRSLAVSYALLGVRSALVVGHTECGLCGATNEDVRGSLDAAADTDFLPFMDLEQSVRDSVRRIRESPLLPDSFAARGFVYEVRNGRLNSL